MSDLFSNYKEASAPQGRIVDHSVHRVVLNVVVAKTNADAKRLAIEGGMGRAWSEELGGAFGTLLMYSYDYVDKAKSRKESMRLIAKEVMPHIPT